MHLVESLLQSWKYSFTTAIASLLKEICFKLLLSKLTLSEGEEMLNLTNIYQCVVLLSPLFVHSPLDFVNTDKKWVAFRKNLFITEHSIISFLVGRTYAVRLIIESISSKYYSSFDSPHCTFQQAFLEVFTEVTRNGIAFFFAVM